VQRVFLIHGWGGSPNNDWLPWAKRTLVGKGYEVFTPTMPDTEHPKITPWVDTLKEIVGQPRVDDVFVGHSIGCQTVLRYLEMLPENQKVSRVILIAPWWFLTLDANEEQADADPWLKIDIDFGKIKTKANKFVAVFSDNDPFVTPEKNLEFFRENLNPEIIVKRKMGHFIESDGVKDLPFLLKLLNLK